jgi:hypothetical protein
VYLWRPLRFKKSDRIECPSASHIGTATEKGPDPAAKGELLSWVKTPVVLSMVYAKTLLDLEDYGAPTSKEFYALKPGTYSLAAQFNRMPFPRDAFRVQTVGFGRLRLQPAGERSYDMVNPEAGGPPYPTHYNSRFQPDNRRPDANHVSEVTLVSSAPTWTIRLPESSPRPIQDFERLVKKR